MLSDSIQYSRLELRRHCDSGLRLTPLLIDYLCDTLRGWESEARNMEGRLEHLGRAHRPLDGTDAVFSARPAEVASRVVSMTDEEIAAREAERGAA